MVYFYFSFLGDTTFTKDGDKLCELNCMKVKFFGTGGGVLTRPPSLNTAVPYCILWWCVTRQSELMSSKYDPFESLAALQGSGFVYEYVYNKHYFQELMKRVVNIL